MRGDQTSFDVVGAGNAGVNTNVSLPTEES